MSTPTPAFLPNTLPHEVTFGHMANGQPVLSGGVIPVTGRWCFTLSVEADRAADITIPVAVRGEDGAVRVAPTPVREHGTFRVLLAQSRKDPRTTVHIQTPLDFWRYATDDLEAEAIPRDAAVITSLAVASFLAGLSQRIALRAVLEHVSLLGPDTSPVVPEGRQPRTVRRGGSVVATEGLVYYHLAPGSELLRAAQTAEAALAAVVVTPPGGPAPATAPMEVA